MYITYKGRNNSVAVQLLRNSMALTPVQMQDISKVELLFLGSFYDSDENPEAFDWTTREGEGVLIIKPGEIEDIEAGWDARAELIIYNTAYPDGVVWTKLDLRVDDLAGE